MLPVKLETSSQIISYILSLSYFIESVKITEVHKCEFSFVVNVPFWYKMLFGRMLRRSIENNLKNRMILGVEFKFDILTK